MKRFALSLAALLVAAPAVAQVVTIPAPTIPLRSLAQGWNTDVAASISVMLYGYTPNARVPHLLTTQTAKIAPAALLQTQVKVEFPGNATTEMTVMQVIIKSVAEAATFQSTSEMVTPKQPLSIRVPAGKKLWVVYSAPQTTEPTLSFYVGTPPAGTAPTIVATPSSVAFTYSRGGALPAPKSITVTGGSWSTNDQSPFYDAPTCWVGFNRICQSGAQTTLTPSEGMKSLPAGTHRADLTIKSQGLPDTVVAVTVTVK